MFHLQRQLAGEYIEELPRLLVKVPRLRRSRRHQLFDYVQLRGPQQIPPSRSRFRLAPPHL